MTKAGCHHWSVCALIVMFLALPGCAPQPQPFTATGPACRELLENEFSRHASGSPPHAYSAPGYGSASLTPRQSEAAELTAEGISKYNDGDFRGAIRSLGNAYEREPSKANTLYTARSFRQLQCDSEARDFYRGALANFSTELRAEERMEATNFVHPPPSPAELARAEKEAAERAAAEEAARLQEQQRVQEEINKHNEVCNAVRNHSERRDLELLQQNAALCPEALTDIQRAWLTEHKKSLEMAKKYEKARSGNSREMERFYDEYYDTGDSRVEEIRKLAESKFGPANPARFKTMSRSLKATSTPSFTVALCDIVGDTAKVELAMTNYTAAVGLGSLLTGNGGDFFARAAKAQRLSQDSTIKNTKRITGAKHVELYNSCSSPHWYLSDRPWPPPPKREPKK